MKRLVLTLALMLTLVVSTQAMSYEQARQQALFLTDKMAYELNLTEEQYEAAYEVNLDYLMSVNTIDDVYSVYWKRRNMDLSYILFDWQYRAFCDALYFYRPLYWDAGYWHFRIYTRYPQRQYFYFGRPHFWTVYRGGHSWHKNGGHSWYKGRTFGNHTGSANHHGNGMRDRFDRGEWKNNHKGNGRGGNNGLGNKPGKDNKDNNKMGNGSPGHNKGTLNGSRAGRYDNGKFSSGNNQNKPQSDIRRGSSTRTTVNKSTGSTPQSTKIERGSAVTSPKTTFTPSTKSTTTTRQSTTTRTTQKSTFTPSRTATPSSARSSSVSRSSGSSRSSGGTTSRSGSFGGKR